jgi:predicted TIM-barrel fold metal-dependent hydrolase
MMIDFKLISVDSHMTEHPDCFKRVQKEFPERAPRVVENPDGVGKGLWFVMEGLQPMHVGYFALGNVVEKPHGRKDMLIYRNSDEFKNTVTKFREEYRYEDHKADWSAPEYLAALEKDGVDIALVYASWARYNFHLEDQKLQRSLFSSYNEWMFEWVSYAPKQLFFAPLLSILDVDQACKDMRDYVKRGCKTVHLPTQIIGSGFYEDKYDKLWATAVDLNIPLSVHANSSQGRPMKLHGLSKRENDPRKYIIRGDFNPNGGPQAGWEFMSNLIFSGVFDRYPTLKVVASEFQMSDAAAAYEAIDYRVGRAATYDSERNVNKRWPSEYLAENCYFGFEDSRATVLTTPFFGKDNFMWSNDYPHFQTPWPHSVRIFEENCEGIDPAIQRKIGRDNANKIYKFY